MTIGTTVALIAAGLLLVFCEVFVPGGVLGLCGAIAVLVGIVGAFTRGVSTGLTATAAALGFGLCGFYLWVKYFPRSRVGKKLILQDDAHDWHGFDTSNAELLGKEGVAHSMLRPAGTALIDGRRVDVVSRGEMIDPESRIEVIEVEGNRVVVKQL